MDIIHHPFHDLRREIDKINRREDKSLEKYSWFLPTDIREEQNRFVVKIDVPGVEPKDIHVSIEGYDLVITGNRQTIDKESGRDYHRIERVEGGFYRSITLPDSADLDSITAHCKHGVMTISIPKKEKSKAKKIEVNDEN